MTGGIIEALQEEREVVLGICAGLSEADWAAESGCPGWSVKDVVSHLGAGYWMVADPPSRPAGSADHPDRATRRPGGPDNLRRRHVPALGDPAGDPGRGGRRDVGDAGQLAIARSLRIF